MYHNLFIQPPMEGRLGCFHVWELWTKLLYTSMCKFFVNRFSAPLGKYQEQSLYHTLRACFFFFFFFVRNQQTVFLSGCAIVCSSWQRVRAPVALRPSQPVFGGIRFPDLGHSNRCGVVSHFNLHFSDDIWCRASSSMCFCHSLVIYRKSLANF